MQDFQEYGLFIGCQLLKSEIPPRKNIKSRKFYDEINSELESFLEIYTYSKENVEKWFER